MKSKSKPVTEVSDVIKKMVISKGPLLASLLAYIKDNQDNKTAITRESVAKYMNAHDLSSRVTTLNMINALLKEGILLDDITYWYYSNLKVNADYNFDGLLDEVLHSQIQETLKKLQPFEHFTGKKLKLTTTHLMKD